VQQDSDRTWAGSFIAGGTSGLTIDERTIGDVTVLKLSGALLLDEGEVALRTSVQQLMAKGRIKLVLDLERVTQVDSSGVAVLIVKLQAIRKLGGDIRLAHLTARYQRLLTTMRVLPLFNVFEDETAAVQSYSDAG
jgi:anti-sigma B factor antagonist